MRKAMGGFLLAGLLLHRPAMLAGNYADLTTLLPRWDFALLAAALILLEWERLILLLKSLSRWSVAALLILPMLATPDNYVEILSELKEYVPGTPESTSREAIRAICQLGKPTVLVLLNGSALAFNWEAQHVPAIVEAWYPGQAGGTALADVLFGDYNPAGRLPVTFYRSIDQIPAFENYDMKGKTYRYFKGTPLYPFGYGLSYSTFRYDDLQVPATLQAGDSIRTSIKVTNTSQRDGDEVVQLYVSLHNTGLKVPLRSLQGFKRIHLKAGQSQTVSFTLQPSQMAGRDENNAPMVTAGKLSVYIGGSQPTPQAKAGANGMAKDVPITGDTYFIK